MAIRSSVVTVLTTPTLIVSALSATVHDRRIIILTGASASLFVGGEDVSVANGFPMALPAAQVTLELGPGDSVFGIVAAGSATINVIATR